MKKIYLITEGQNELRNVGVTESRKKAKEYIRKHELSFPKIAELNEVDDFMNTHIFRVTFDCGAVKCDNVDGKVDEIGNVQIIDKENFGVLKIATVTAKTPKQAIARAEEIFTKGKCAESTGE